MSPIKQIIGFAITLGLLSATGFALYPITKAAIYLAYRFFDQTRIDLTPDRRYLLVSCVLGAFPSILIAETKWAGRIASAIGVKVVRVGSQSGIVLAGVMCALGTAALIALGVGYCEISQSSIRFEYAGGTNVISATEIKNLQLVQSKWTGRKETLTHSYYAIRKTDGTFFPLIAIYGGGVQKLDAEAAKRISNIMKVPIHHDMQYFEE